MTRRTKLWICLGLLVLAVAVELVRELTAKPPLELRFITYTNFRGEAVLGFTNHWQLPI